MRTISLGKTGGEVADFHRVSHGTTYLQRTITGSTSFGIDKSPVAALTTSHGNVQVSTGTFIQTEKTILLV